MVTLDCSGHDCDRTHRANVSLYRNEFCFQLQAIREAQSGCHRLRWLKQRDYRCDQADRYHLRKKYIPKLPKIESTGSPSATKPPGTVLIVDRSFLRLTLCAFKRSQTRRSIVQRRHLEELSRSSDRDSSNGMKRFLKLCSPHR